MKNLTEAKKIYAAWRAEFPSLASWGELTWADVWRNAVSEASASATAPVIAQAVETPVVIAPILVIEKPKFNLKISVLRVVRTFDNDAYFACSSNKNEKERNFRLTEKGLEGDVREVAINGKTATGLSLTKEEFDKLSAIKIAAIAEYKKDAAEKAAAEKAEAEKVTIETFVVSYHTSDKWRVVETIPACKYGARDDVKAMIDSLNRAVETESLKAYQTDYRDNDYSLEYIYTVPAAALTEIVKKSVEDKAAKDAVVIAAKKEVAEAEKAKAQAFANEIGFPLASAIRAEKQIRFFCESRPHTENLDGVALNAPYPRGGAFVTSDRIDKSDWAAVAAHARYYDKEFLEECDMFNTAPGWRFSVEALRVLREKGYTVTLIY